MFIHFLFFFLFVAFIFSYLFFSFYCIFQKQLPLKNGIPSREIDLIKSIFSKRSAFHWRNREVFFCCILWVTLDDLYTYKAKQNTELLIRQALDFLYVKLFLVHKKRKRKRLISQFLQSRDRGFNWLNMGGFHASCVFKLCFKHLLGECCVFKFAALSNCWRHGNTTWDKVLGMGKQPLVRLKPFNM